MERTTLYLDTATKRRLKDEARRRSVPEASIVREALAEYLVGKKPSRPRPVGRSKDGGVAHRLDEALEETGFGQRPPR